MEPHRGAMVLIFGILGIVLCCACVGSVFGILAVVFGSQDLRAMAEGRMDPSGQGTTLAGKIIGIVSLCLGFLWLIYLIICAIVFRKFGLPPGYSSYVP